MTGNMRGWRTVLRPLSAGAAGLLLLSALVPAHIHATATQSAHDLLCVAATPGDGVRNTASPDLEHDAGSACLALCSRLRAEAAVDPAATNRVSHTSTLAGTPPTTSLRPPRYGLSARLPRAPPR